MRRLTEDGLNRAFRDLQNGMEIVGENALLYSGMGEAYIYQYEFGIKVEETTLKKAQEYIYKVLKLDSNSSHSHHLLGMMARHESVLKAIPHFKRALSDRSRCTRHLILARRSLQPPDGPSVGRSTVGRKVARNRSDSLP